MIELIMSAYSLDLGKKITSYIDDGHSQAGVAGYFKLHPITIGHWIKLSKTTGSLKVTPVPRSPHKLQLAPMKSLTPNHFII